MNECSTRSITVFGASVALLVISCISVLSLLQRENTEYRILSLLPIVFTLMYYITIYHVLKRENCCYVSITVVITYCLRCVIYPFLFSLCESNYIGARYLQVSQSELNWSVILIAFETVVALFFVYIWDNRYSQRNNNQSVNIEIKGAKLVYGIYIVLAIVLYVLIGRRNQVINFISFNSETGYQAIESTTLKLVRQIIVVAIAITFCLICNYCKKRYDKTGKGLYVTISIIAAMINTAVIIGNRRSTQLIVMLLSVIILRWLFPNYKRRITLSIISTGVAVILIITLYRWGATSETNLSVLRNKTGSIEQLTTMIQQSYGGPDSVANGIKFGRRNGITVLNFIYDMGRSIFGLSFIFSRFGVPTSNLYNLYLYSGKYETGQLLFSTSYGYITLGIFYPLITMLNILIAYLIERWFRRTNSMEVKYMSEYCLMRVMLGSVQSLPSIITVATMQIGTMGLVILIAHVFARKNKEALVSG